MGRILTVLSPSREFLQAYRAGRVCLHPSDTLPGLSYDPLQPAAKTALLRLKGRPESKTSLSLITSLALAQKFWQPLPAVWEQALTKLWPGPLSVIWQASSRAPSDLIAGDGTLALRCPHWTSDKEWMAEVLEDLAAPMPTSSVNQSGQLPASSWQDAVTFLNSSNVTDATSVYCPSLAVAPQFLPGTQASTLIRLAADGSFTVLREGALPLTAIKALLLT